jgi:hypothetical protein
MVLCALFCLFHKETRGAVVYHNSFDATSAIDGFDVTLSNGDLEVIDGQLRMTTYHSYGVTPNGSISAMLNYAEDVGIVGQTLKSSSGVMTWAVNIANQSGGYNNGGALVLASSSVNPFDIPATGYAVLFGGSAFDRMYLKRFDYGLGGGSEILIDTEFGLSELPLQGSLKVTYDPTSDQWEMFFAQSGSYANPLEIETSFGTAVDDRYTSDPLNYFGINGRNTGLNYFDNLTMDVVPEASTITLLFPGLILVGFMRRRFRR